jgi:L,D-transpeptidase ErfK/SrfK
MAMKRLVVLISFPIIFITGILIIILIIRGGKEPVTEVVPYSDSLITALPSDTKTAQKELKRVKNALAKFKPTGPYLVINTHANEVYYRTEDSVLYKAVCSTGSGGELIDSTTDRKWKFETPKGAFKINSKLKDPWWRKPDWAFIEENETIPKDERERYDDEMLGAFAMGFGNGYFVHGTVYERLLGISVTHGCVRLGEDDLKYIFDRAKIGTPLYIF